jgi:hypothetical protein
MTGEPPQQKRKRAIGPLTLASVAIAVAGLAAAIGIGVLGLGILPADEKGRQEASSGSNVDSSETTRIASSQHALNLTLHNLRTAGMLQATASPNVTIDEMAYGEAADKARGLGVNLIVRPEGYVCPPDAGCPYPGEPAEARGWFIVIRGLAVSTPGATGYFAWVGEDGGMTSGNTR